MQYHFYVETELRACFERVHADFLEQALPWLERFPTLTDVVGEYYRYRIGPLASGEERPPNPFVWANYGWLLLELQQEKEAKKWLERAYLEIRRPTFWKDGRPVAEGTRGARQLPPRGEDIRLEELLRQSLKLPIE